MRTKTRAVLGGSFDPVHNGHVAMAQFVLEKGLAHQVHVVPAHLSPFKQSAGSEASHRLAMVKLAFVGLPNVQIEEMELQRGGPSFTVDTLEELARRFPQDNLLLIVGQDNLAGLMDWKSPRRIGQLATVAVLAREGSSPGKNATGEMAGIHFQYFPDFHQPVSSTQVRAMLASGKNGLQELGDTLPKQVVSHIRHHHLYEDSSVD